MKNTRKLWFIAIIALIGLATMSCDNGNDTHSHAYGEWTSKTAATCTAAEVQERLCSCGEKETQNIGSALGHDWDWTLKAIAPTVTEDGKDQGTCQRTGCSETNIRFSGEYATGTAGLAFTAIDSPATAYTVKRGTVTTGVVNIHAYHRPTSDDPYLPITQIGTSADLSAELFAFGYTTITAVNLPSSITIINSNAFRYCTNLTEITLPAEVTNLRSSVFNGCSSLETVTILATIPPILAASNVFTGNHVDMVIRVPGTSIETYKTASTEWIALADKIVAIE